MSLVELGWRQFTFFDKSTIKDPNNPDEKYSGLKDLKACCCAFGSNFALFGEANGGVLKLTSNLDDYSWMAHKCLLVDIALAENILATVGEDEEGINSLVKLWQLDRVEKGAPFCVRVIRACPLLGSGRCPRACIVALHSSHQHIAIGFDDSSVLYCNGNILKEKSGKWITVANGINVGLRTELTGLALAWLPARNTCVLYCMSTTNIRSFAIAKTVTNTITHDSKGCRRNCWSFNVELNRLTVGSPEMVHFYEAEDSIGESGAIDGKGKCYALGRCNEKIQLLSYESYVILLTRQPITTASADNVFNWVVSIFDIDCQCIAFSCAIPPPAWIIIFDDVVMILGQDGTLASLTEKRLSAKIDILSKKNLFDLAVGLAKRSALGGDYLPDIHRQYGDYLYKSGDFDNAVQQYGETIGSLQPSYVIKKFLNGSLIKELSTYLEVLHSKRKASSHHTTILFNCYTRLRSEEKIRKLIEQDFECDVAVICQMLRTAGFIEAACALCEKSDMVDMLLNIYIEERHDYSSVFKYIEKLDQSLTVEYLEKYGKLLLEKCPDETMDFLSKIINSSASFDANRLMKIFVENVERCSQFVEIVLKVDRDNSKLRNLLFELRLRQKVQDEKEITDSELVSLIGEKDLDDVLQICRMFDFMPGIIHIFTKQKRFDELIEFYLERGNIKEIIELCETKSNPTLWISALSYVSREASVNTETIQLLLEKIERTKSIHPLVVLEILSKSDTICIGHVQDYIIKWLKEQNDLISDDQKQIHEYEQKMASIEEDIEDLNSNIQIFQTNKCSACDTLLQLPAIHFLCKHAYHAHCLESYSEKADYCPACIRNDSRLSGEESSNDELNSKASYKKFQEEISNSIDCIETLAHYVARGVYSSAQDNTNQSKPDRRMTENSLDSRIVGFQDEFPAPASESSLLSPGAALNPFDEVGDTYSTNPFYHP